MEVEMAMQRRKDPSSMSRICCWKKCIMGPKKSSTSPKVANLINIIMIAFNIVTLCYTLKGMWQWLVIINIIIGCLASVLMWCVMCSDPGIINRNQDESKLTYFAEQQAGVRESGQLVMNFEDPNLSLTSFEEHAVNEDNQVLSDPQTDRSLIFKESRFYQYRECPTCDIQRLPKASHCAACNNCVKGYDHHCTLLNNCVGKRTLRAFITLLLCSWTFYLLSGIIAAISLLYEPYSTEYSEYGKVMFDYELVINLVVVLLQTIKFVLLCCLRQYVSFAIAVIWIAVEAILVLGLSISTLYGKTMAAAFMLSLSFSFMLFVWPLLTKHMDFIAHHLTEKEFHARLETMNRMHIEDVLVKSMNCK